MVKCVVSFNMYLNIPSLKILPKYKTDYKYKKCVFNLENYSSVLYDCDQFESSAYIDVKQYLFYFTGANENFKKLKLYNFTENIVFFST